MHMDDVGYVDVAIEIDYTDKSMSRGGYSPTHVVLHGTAGGSSAENVAAYFAAPTTQASSHFIIGQDGHIVQGIPCSLAAWGNGVLTKGHAPYLPDSVNPNLYTISIEHVKASTDNSDALTDVQAHSSFALINCICSAYSIPKRAGDAQGGIISHADIDPLNRSRCPGLYPWTGLYSYLQQGGSTMGIPQGWTDDGTTLTAPNGHRVMLGFRQYILNHVWDTADVPLEEEYPVSPVEDYYDQGAQNAGTRQLFVYTELAYTPARGVYRVGIGNEVRGLRNSLNQAQKDQTINDWKVIASIASKHTL